MAAVARYRAGAGALEVERREHARALRVHLGDPNAGAALQGLCAAEASRSAAMGALIAHARESMLGARVALGVGAACALAHTTALLALVCQEVLAPWDLAPLPGDEYVPPTKLSFKRLHKTLRRAGGEAAALAAAVLGDEGAVEEGAVAPLEGSGLAQLLEHQRTAAAAAAAVSATGKGGAAVPSGGGGKDKKGAGGGAGGAATGAPQEGEKRLVPRGARDHLMQHTWPGLSPHPRLFFLVEEGGEGAAAAGGSGGGSGGGGGGQGPTFGVFQSFLGPASRHAVAFRDAAYAALCAEHREACSEIRARFALAQAEAERWDRVWEARVASLTASQGLAAVGLSLPSIPKMLPLPGEEEEGEGEGGEEQAGVAAPPSSQPPPTSATAGMKK